MKYVEINRNIKKYEEIQGIQRNAMNHMKYKEFGRIRQNQKEVQRNGSKPDGPHIHRSTGRPGTKSRTGISKDFISNSNTRKHEGIRGNIQKYEEVRRNV